MKKGGKFWLKWGCSAIIIFSLLTVMTVSADHLTITLSAESYRIQPAGDGYQSIEMANFGALNIPGEPQLPAKTFLIAIPPGAVVRQVQLSPQAPSEVPGLYRIIPAHAVIEGESMADTDIPMRIEAAQSEWQTNYDRVYNQDDFHPAKVATYEGSGRWRNYDFIRVRYCPFQYRPASGRLYAYPSCTVSIDYDRPSQDKVYSDHTLDDLIAPYLVNFEQAQSYFTVEVTEPLKAKYDYVIIVEDEDMRKTVSNFRAWKEKLGFSVKVVTTDSIYQHVSGRDKAERIWKFLRDNYSVEYWDIRYVLLIGDVDRLPQRLLYPSDTASPYASDFYYACLNINWDVDGDRRWGEFQDDSFMPTPDVLVGRIPFNDSVRVRSICDNIIDFEKDTDAWKNKTLMAMGVLDYFSGGRTDCAVLAEYLKTHVFDLHAWSYTTLYEKNGLSPSTYTCDSPLSENNYLSYRGPERYGVINLSAHGNPNGLGSMVWAKDLNGNGVCDGKKKTAEWTYTWFSGIGNITTDCVSSMVILNGCSTGPLLGHDANFANSHSRSLYLVTVTRNSMAKEYIENGAVGVIASSAGSDYCHNWSKPGDGHSQSFDYYYHDFLVNKNQKIGDAHYSAHMEYATKHNLQRGILDFGFLGDPSINLRGYEDHPGGADIVIHDSTYYDFAADNADDGDIYVAVLTNNPKTGFFMGYIKIYKSTDHGTSWSLWHTVSARIGFRALDVLVSEFGSDEFKDPRLLLITSDLGGEVALYRISLSTGYEDRVSLSNEGTDSEIWNIQITRDPIPKSFKLYVTYDVYNAKTSLQHLIKFCRSSSNGISWQDWVTYNDYYLPSIDAGPNGKVYWAAVKYNQTEDVCVRSSSDYGASWGSWTNLTANDGGTSHDTSTPCVAASTDGAIPTVWVAYDYYNSKVNVNGNDIRYACSIDAGASWTKNKVLTGNAGDERYFDMNSYRASPNRWLNIAYYYGSNNPAVMWQWSSGSFPLHWHTPRLINDNAADDVSSQKVVYSPGSPVTGSGVVYGGASDENVYFSAPWLSSKFQMEQYGEADELTLSPEPGEDAINLKLFVPVPDRVRVQIHNAAGTLVRSFSRDLPNGRHEIVWDGRDQSNQPVATGQYLCTVHTSSANATALLNWQAAAAEGTQLPDDIRQWQNTADLEGAFIVSDIIPTHDGALYTAVVSNVDETKNEGRIFFTHNNGESWERSNMPPDGWSLSRLFQTSRGTLLAGGLAWVDEEPRGFIYRKEAGAMEWAPVLFFPHGSVYDMIEIDEGQLYAVSGWNGQIFKSENDGIEWHEIFTGAPGTHIYAIMYAEGAFFIGGEDSDNNGFIWKSDNGQDWMPMDGLEGVMAVYDLMPMPDKRLAGVRANDGGWVYELSPMPPLWTKLVEFPESEVRAVHCLTHDEAGGIYAGVEMSPGPSSTRVYGIMPPYTQWQIFGSEIDMANTTYVLCWWEGALFAGTGPVYGNIYRYDLETGVAVEDDQSGRIPANSDLSLNYPNPFNPATRIDYQVGRGEAHAQVIINIYDILGREVMCLVNETKKPGYYSILWHGVDRRGGRVATGIYFCRMRAGNFVKTIKVVVSK
ncbi:T9SS type A sorting domain-containing protein [candidate division KSB1 bacterium]|nr:T9SS type A sorting domain-containing protein [candidate division KSB1 bacterium]